MKTIEQQTAAAIRSIELGNNGHADIGASTALADAVRAAGYVVIAARDLHNRPVFRGFTAAGQRALRAEPFGVSTYRAPVAQLDLPDYYEAAILARDARMTAEF